MKCFNHENCEAVAYCQNCGKGLCKECAEKHVPCLCDDCYKILQERNEQEKLSQEEERRMRYRNSLVNTRSEFVKTSIIGLVLALIMVSGSRDGNRLWWFFVCFTVPFGWNLLTYVQSFFSISLFGTIGFWMIWIIIKFIFSAIIGIPSFIYQTIKVITAQKKINILSDK